MAIIKMFHAETYPKEIVSVRERLQDIPNSEKEKLKKIDFLRDYMNDIVWKPDSPIGMIHNNLMEKLENHEIVLYHNTRILDINEIKKSGLIFSDERYINSLIRAMKKESVDQELIEEVIEIIRKEISRWNERNGENKRKNAVCYIYDIDYYKDYEKFLVVYGGEFMEFGLSGKVGDTFTRYKKIVRIGKPCVVEFSVPYKWFHKFEKMDIARYMIEEWIHLDVIGDDVSHQYDGRIEKEIPPEKIIDIHIVEDDFQKWYEYYEIE